MFFEKGSSTNEIWYYEHRLPKGQKSYSKTKVIQFEEFSPIIEWWNDRKESEVSWKVNIKDLNNWDLDLRNPTLEDKVEIKSSSEIINLITSSLSIQENLLGEFKTLLQKL